MWAPLVLLLIVGGLEGASLGQSSQSRDEVTQSEVSSPLHVAQCRANCLQQILLPSKEDTRPGEIPDCRQDPQCHVCWRKCEELEIVAQWRKSAEVSFASESSKTSKNSKTVAAICSTSSCGSGCGIACNFYTSGALSPSSPVSPLPVVATKSRALLLLSPGKVSWSKEEEGPLVYVLIQQLPHLKWSQVTQTTQTWAPMPKTLWDKLEFGVRSVRVLVVSPKGLVAIYNPQQQTAVTSQQEVTTSTTTSTSTISSRTSSVHPVAKDDEMERTWSQMMKVDENYPPMTSDKKGQGQPQGQSQGQDDIIVTKHVYEVKEEEEIVDDPWGLRRLSLIHQKSLVIAELAWDEGFKSSPEQEYLITWELDGGGLKGHLVTDSTTVSLSLWPDTLYHIQVELFEPNFEEGETEQQGLTSSSSKSLPLVVDTSEASFPLLVEKPSALSSRRLLSTTTLVGVILGFTLVLGSLLVAISLRRLCSHRGHHRGHQSFSPDKDRQLLQDTDDVEAGVAVVAEKKTGQGTKNLIHPSQNRVISVISLSGSGGGGCDLHKGPNLHPQTRFGFGGPFQQGPSPTISRPNSLTLSKGCEHLGWLNNSPSRAPSSNVTSGQVLHSQRLWQQRH